MDHKIEKYMAIVEAESFTDAAERLHISQPALSVTLQNLERELGVQLIIRGGNYFQVTEAGKLVYDYGVRFRLQEDNLLKELGEEIKSQRILRLGMIDSVADMLFDSDQIDFDGQTEVRIDNTSRLIHEIELDRTDMAFITEPLGSISDKFRVRKVGDERFVLVCAQKKASDVRKSIKKDKLIPDFLTYDHSSTTFKRISAHLSKLNIVYQPKFFSTSPDLLRQMALRGKGAALLPLHKVENDIKRKELTVVRSVNFTRPIVALTLEGKYLNDEMKGMIDSVNNGLQQRPQKRRSGHYA